MQVPYRSSRVVIGILYAGFMACVAAAPDDKGQSRAALLAEAKLPKPVELPHPQDAVVLPDDLAASANQSLAIQLSQDAPAGSFIVRRVSTGDGRLYLGIRSTGSDLAGTADVTHVGRIFHAKIAGGELWLSLKPRFGRINIKISSPGAAAPVELVAPTTLVETRGRQIFVNGEPFLIKGAMSRNLNEHDAAYVHSLGINTLRGFEALADCERYGFMSIVSLNFGQAAPKTSVNASDADFAKTLTLASQWLRDNSAAAIASPNTLILQLGNEKTPGSNKPPGAASLTSPRRHVAELLVTVRNVIKPLAPALLASYSNQDLGFLAPDCMDVYMHNSFLDKDRYHYNWDDLLRWQGCLPPDGPAGQGRPFVNSEFGSNRYLCQAYHGGPNNPFLEKLHAWNFPNRWAEFMEHGTAGGSIYCLYDLEHPTDQGCSCFGILTYDGKPKLACWDIEHMWRDFDAAVQSNNLILTYKRDYHAQDCRLTLTTNDGKSLTHRLEDFAPRATQTIALSDLGLGGAAEFHWKIDFTTHAGLPNQAQGAWPLQVEQRDFLDRLKSRDTYPFLRELFDAQVMTADGKAAPRTLAEMTRPDGIIPVALHKPSGVTYVLLISRENIGKSGPLLDGVSIDLSYHGKVEQVDDMTGQPLSNPVDATSTPAGLHLQNLQAARIPGAIGSRSDNPFKLPIYRISP